jgi:hypothetical protein
MHAHWLVDLPLLAVSRDPLRISLMLSAAALSFNHNWTTNSIEVEGKGMRNFRKLTEVS